MNLPWPEDELLEEGEPRVMPGLVLLVTDGNPVYNNYSVYNKYRVYNNYSVYTVQYPHLCHPWGTL